MKSLLVESNFVYNLTKGILAGLWLAFSAGGALAALGQAPLRPASTAATASVRAVQMLAAPPVLQTSLYSVQEVQLASGTLVREYSNLAGVVFAVTWRGPVLPNLSELLGSHFSTFKQEVEQARATGKRGGPVSISRPELVVSSGGRMRNFFGHAYAPALIPTGVNIDDLLQ